MKDIFDACAKDDESRIKAQLKEGSVLAREPVANLDNFHDNTNDEHFGNVVQSSGQSSKSNNVVHQNIIKRSIFMVLLTLFLLLRNKDTHGHTFVKVFVN